MTLSSITKGYKKKWLICYVLSILCTFGPVIGFGIYALAVSDTTTRLALTMMSILSMGIAIMNVLFKYSFRTAVYLMILALSLALKEMTATLVIVTVCTGLDEFVFEPLTKSFKNKYTINKEIDRREP